MILFVNLKTIVHSYCTGIQPVNIRDYKMKNLDTCDKGLQPSGHDRQNCCDKTEATIGFLFDLDGVLIDSETEYTRIWQEIDRQYPTGVDNFAIKIKGQTLPEILNRHYPAHLHQNIIDMLNSMEQKMRYEMLPGAREMLEALRERGIGCVLVTSSNDVKMRHLREEQPELEGFFADIVTADRISRSKPDPEGYLLGASLLGVAPERCVVFEDSAQGVRAGHAAGAYVTGLTTTLPKEQLEPYCDLITGTLADVDLDRLITILENR